MALITTDLDQAVSQLLTGKPVAIPTETVYGLAAPINNEQAIRTVFAIKNRPLNHPLIVHVAPKWDLSELVETIPPYVQQLINQFWPGPLTLVLKCNPKKISPIITGGQTTVAIRCPAHPLAQELLNKLQIPVVAPSANSFGKVSPTTAQHVQESFPDESFFILDGGRCTVGIESTIIDVSHYEYYQILRHGLIDEAALAEIIAVPSLTKHSTIRVPGKLHSHYQPQKPLYYFADYQNLKQFCESKKKNIYAIASQQPKCIQEKHFYQLPKNPKQAAFDLYFQLRQADASEAECIVIELPPEDTSWQGVRERILKAGTTYVFEKH